MSLAPPVPATEPFYVTGGTLPTDAPSYVPRQADHDLLHGLTQGEFCYVLNTRQMGKSSLMVRTAQALRAEGATVAVLDLTAVGLNLTPDQWYGGLLASLGEQLHLEDALEDFWDDNAALGPLQRFMTALGRVALPQVPQRLVLFVDEIDAVRSLPFPADEFFAAIRECYNRRRTDPLYEKLTFCLLGVATPADLIRDTKLSPFNIGRRILLTDFTSAEAAPLAQGLPGGSPTLARILYWTGGHPYMTQRLCRAVAEEGVTTSAGVDAVCERLFLTKQARESDDNLAFVRARLLRSEVDLASLLDLYVQVRGGKRVKDDETNPLCGVLRLSGVAKALGAWLEVRNRVYDRVFDREWVLAHMPDAELRRQRAAYRLGLLRAAAVAAVVLALMGLLSGWAIGEAHRADANARRARTLLTAEQQAETQARGDEQRAQSLAASLQTALTQERQETQIARQKTTLADAKTLLAQASDRNAHRQALLAQVKEQEALTEKGAATVAAHLALTARLAALRQKAEAVRQKQYAQQTQQAADLQLAGETFDSDTGTAAAVQNLLASSQDKTVGGGSERFEWRYLWSLLHDGLQMHDIFFSDAAAVTPQGNLVALDGEYVLHQTSAQGNRVSDVKLPDLATVTTAALSSDGTQVAVGRRSGRIEILNAATLQTVTSWQAGLGPFDTLKFDEDGGLQGMFDNRNFTRWNPATGQVLTHWTAEQDVIPNGRESLQAWSPNGRYRAMIGYVDNVAWLKDMTRSEEIGYSPTPLPSNITITAIAFSGDSRTVAIGDFVGDVSLWDVATGKVQRRWLASVGHVLSLRFLQNDSELAVGSNNGLVSIWTTQQNLDQTAAADLPSPVASYKGHMYPVTFLNFSQRHWLVSCDSGGAIRAWNLNGADHRLAASSSISQFDCMSRLVFAPDGKWLVGISIVGHAAAWDAASGNFLPLPVFLRNEDSPASAEIFNSVAFSPDGRTVAVSGVEDYWASPGAKAAGIAASTERIFMQIWNQWTGRPVARWQSPPFPFLPNFHVQSGLSGLAFSSNGRMIAGGFGSNYSFGPDRDYSVKVWNAATGKIIKTLVGFRNATNSLAFAPDGATLAVGSHDKTVHCYDTRTWRETRQLNENDPVTSLAYSPDGHWLATGCNSGVITLTDTRTWLSPQCNIGVTTPVYDLCFSPDSRTLASCGVSSIANLWDVDSFQETRSLRLEANAWSLAFSPDGTSLAVGEGDTAVILRAAPAARIANWERADVAETDVNTPLRQAKTFTWKNPAQIQADAQALLQPEQADSPVLLREVEGRRVPGYADASQANLLPTAFDPSRWRLVLQSGSPAMAVLRAAPAGTAAVHVTGIDGDDWHVMVYQDHMPLTPGQHYVLQMLARAAVPVTIRLDTENDIGNSHNGLEGILALTPKWQAFRFPFILGNAVGTSALSISVGQKLNTIQFADAVLVPVPTEEDQSPAVPLEATGYNAGLIAGGRYDPSNPTAALASIQRTTTTTIDGQFDYYAKGFNPAEPGVGLPVGQTFASHDDPSVHFHLRLPGKSNALLLTNSSATGTLTLARPGRFQRVAFLVTGLNGDHHVYVRLNFADGTSLTEDFHAPDNFENDAINVALSGFDRVGVLADEVGFTGANPVNPTLFDVQFVLPAADARRLLTSMTLTKDRDNHLDSNVAVFGVSGG